MNISGHRISTTEVEHALVSHPAVAEAAVVGANDATTGQAIVAFVTVKGASDVDGEAGEELVAGAARPRGPARSARSPSPARSCSRPSCPRPAAARSCAACCATWPRTASSGDVTTLLDPTVVNAIKEHMAEGGAEKE